MRLLVLEFRKTCKLTKAQTHQPYNISICITCLREHVTFQVGKEKKKKEEIRGILKHSLFLLQHKVRARFRADKSILRFGRGTMTKVNIDI